MGPFWAFSFLLLFPSSVNSPPSASASAWGARKSGRLLKKLYFSLLFPHRFFPFLLLLLPSLRLFPLAPFYLNVGSSILRLRSLSGLPLHPLRNWPWFCIIFKKEKKKIYLCLPPFNPPSASFSDANTVEAEFLAHCKRRDDNKSVCNIQTCAKNLLEAPPLVTRVNRYWDLMTFPSKYSL